jgi:DNA-binding MarR family transcriptional regulator
MPTDPNEVALGQLSQLIGYALRRAQQAVAQDFAAVLEAEGLRPIQFAVLEILSANPGLRQARASAALGIQTTNFVPLFDALEQAGLAERRPIPGDRRARGLHLTEAGAARLARLQSVIAAHEARFTARVGVDGRAQLLGLLARLADPAFG